MSKIKGMKKINKKLSKIVSELAGFEIKVKAGNTWLCYPEEDNFKIEIAIILNEIDEIQKEIWQEWWEHRYNYCPENMFIISLLHEIGHFWTYSSMKKYNLAEFNLSQDWTDSCDERSRNLSLAGKENTLEFKQVNLEYFSIPLEAIATDWAEVFYRTNKDRCEKAFLKICKVLAKWYKKNNITEN